MNKGKLASNFAIDFVFSDIGPYSLDFIYDELSNGHIPEEAFMWKPFEDYNADELLKIIDNLANEFLLFYSVLKIKETE